MRDVLRFPALSVVLCGTATGDLTGVGGFPVFRSRNKGALIMAARAFQEDIVSGASS